MQTSFLFCKAVFQYIGKWLGMVIPCPAEALSIRGSNSDTRQVVIWTHDGQIKKLQEISRKPGTFFSSAILGQLELKSKLLLEALVTDYFCLLWLSLLPENVCKSLIFSFSPSYYYHNTKRAVLVVFCFVFCHSFVIKTLTKKKSLWETPSHVAPVHQSIASKEATSGVLGPEGICIEFCVCLGISQFQNRVSYSGIIISSLKTFS